MTADPFDTVPISRAALDKAWRHFHHGGGSYDAARLAMLDAGIPTMAEARGLLDAPQPPSAGYLAVTG